MMKSLYAGVSGLKTHNQRMDVIGNNIANVNTTGFKTSTVTFKDVYYQTKQSASSGSATSGGVNPIQVGYGSALGTINQVMTQSGFTYSDSVYDCAIQGEGFFQVMDAAGNIYYTRAGVFNVDNAGNLVDPNGYVVLGVSGDPTGISAGSQRINLFVPSTTDNKASVSKSLNINGSTYDVTISANDMGEEGNISFTIIHDQTPYASLSGNTLQIYMDLNQPFANAAAFQNAVNEAIKAGGVELSNKVVPLQFNFANLPNSTAAVNATNTLTADLNDAATGGEINLTFTADVAGAFANSYEINLIVSTTTATPTAAWNGNTLTITVPNSAATTVADIQNVINNVAGSDDKRKFTVTGTIDVSGVTESKTLKLGLTGGSDNFFTQVARLLSTVKLSDGRIGKDQSVKDLETVFIDSDGCIYGVHSVHGTILMGRIDIATFENPTGLLQVGTSYWQASLASGNPVVKVAGTAGAGEIVSGALEMSNVDLSQEFSDMIVTQRGFQANSRIITVSDTMLEELINLKR